MAFKGDLDDAAPLKDYLEPQFRAGQRKRRQRCLHAALRPPLAVQGAGADGLIQRLTRLVPPVVHVLATIADKKS